MQQYTSKSKHVRQSSNMYEGAKEQHNFLSTVLTYEKMIYYVNIVECLASSKKLPSYKSTDLF